MRVHAFDRPGRLRGMRRWHTWTAQYVRGHPCNESEVDERRYLIAVHILKHIPASAIRQVKLHRNRWIWLRAGAVRCFSGLWRVFRGRPIGAFIVLFFLG